VTIVTALQTVFDGEAEAVNAPGSEGRLGILPHHAPLLSLLDVGELRIREHGEEESIFVAGGFLEVNRNVVTILADDAELERAVGRLRVAELSHQRHGPRRRRPVPGELPTGNE
jgi:F-type H+-transporting ATPase subunit epsilon